jgi:hypothetical protein
MITLIIIGSVLGGALIAAFGILKFITYKEEVHLLKGTIGRLEELNADLQFKSFNEISEA